MKEHLIFSNYFDDIEKEKNWFLKNETDVNGEPLTEEQAYQLAEDNISFNYECEQDNLNKKLTLVCIANLGLWNGRRRAYQTYDNLNGCLDFHGCDYLKVYVKGVTLHATMSHHDGTNYCKFYVLQDLPTTENFLNDFCNGKQISKSRFYKHLKSAGREVKKIYGF